MNNKKKLNYQQMQEGAGSKFNVKKDGLTTLNSNWELVCKTFKISKELLYLMWHGVMCYREVQDRGITMNELEILYEL